MTVLALRAILSRPNDKLLPIRPPRVIFATADKRKLRIPRAAQRYEWPRKAGAA